MNVFVFVWGRGIGFRFKMFICDLNKNSLECGVNMIRLGL